MLRKGFYLGLVILLLTVAGNWVFFANVNTYQADGQRESAVSDAPVRVVRDGQGVPYVCTGRAGGGAWVLSEGKSIARKAAQPPAPGRGSCE